MTRATSSGKTAGSRTKDAETKDAGTTGATSASETSGDAAAYRALVEEIAEHDRRYHTEDAPSDLRW